MLVPVKMTIAAEEKQETEDTLVVHVSDEGNVEQVEDAIISDSIGRDNIIFLNPILPRKGHGDNQALLSRFQFQNRKAHRTSWKKQT